MNRSAPTQAGIALLAAGLAVASFAPRSAASSTPTCLFQNGQRAQPSSGAAVKAMEVGVTIGACPNGGD